MKHFELVSRTNDIFRKTLARRLGVVAISRRVRVLPADRKRELFNLVRGEHSFSVAAAVDYHDVGVVHLDREQYVFSIEFREKGSGERIPVNQVHPDRCFRVLKILHTYEA